MHPAANIVPLLAIDASNNIRHFLGTACFVQEPTLLLTAYHCIRDWNEDFAICLVTDLNHIFRAQVVFRDIAHDLALLVVSGYIAPTPLKVAHEFDHPNLQIVSFEYGTTVTAGNRTNFNPATRLGNVTRTVNAFDMVGAAGVDALELSFAALRGASGAPVMKNDGQFEVIGIIIANASYHLLPAQIETVLDQQNTLLEETKFMLPQALAVNCKHISRMLAAFRDQRRNEASKSV